MYSSKRAPSTWQSTSQRKVLPQLPPLHDQMLYRYVFTIPSKNSDVSDGEQHMYMVFRGEKYLEYALSECLVEELHKCGVFDATRMKSLHKLMLSTERLVKFSMKYGFDDDIIREGTSIDYSGFDSQVYVNVFKAYVGALLEEGVVAVEEAKDGLADDASIKAWVRALVQYSLDADIKMVDNELLKSLVMNDGSDSFDYDSYSPPYMHSLAVRTPPKQTSPLPSDMTEESVKFSKNLLYKILNPLRHEIDYVVLESSVPPASPLPNFKIACVVDGQQVAIGEAQSKRSAGNFAANALLRRCMWRGNEDELTIETTLKSVLMEERNK